MILALAGTICWSLLSHNPTMACLTHAPLQFLKKPRVSRDWPMLGGTPQRNLVNTLDKDVPTDWDIKTEKNLKWVADLGRTSWGGPVIANGKIFVGTNNERPRNPKIKGDKGILMCLRERDGKFLWQAVHDKLNSEDRDFPRQGVASTPAVDSDRLYYVSNRCELICADAEGFLDGENDGIQNEKYKSKIDADIVWRLDMHKQLNVNPCYLAISSPLVIGDLVFVVTGHGVDPSTFKLPKKPAPSFIAVDKKTGRIRWMDSSPGSGIMEGQWSSPVYAKVRGKGQIIFPGGDGWIYAFEPETGKLIWKFDCNPKKAIWNPKNQRISTRGFPFAVPVVHKNRLYVSIGQNPDNGYGVGHLWCVDLTKKGDVSAEILVKEGKEKERIRKNPNSAVVWHYGGPLPNSKEGPEFEFGRTLSSCAIHDGLLYVAELDGYLHCLNATTGKRVWMHDLETSVWSSPYVVDGKVYLGTDDGDVLIFTVGSKKNLLATLTLGPPIKGSVVVARGVVYVRTDSKLYSFAFKK